MSFWLFQTLTSHLEIILGLPESCKNSSESFLFQIYSLHSASSNVKVLCNHSTIIQTRKLILVQYYWLNYRSYLDFSRFLFVGFVFSVPGSIQDSKLHLVVSLISSNLSLSFITLTLLMSIGQLFCRIFFNLGLSDVSP